VDIYIHMTDFDSDPMTDFYSDQIGMISFLKFLEFFDIWSSLFQILEFFEQ